MSATTAGAVEAPPEPVGRKRGFPTAATILLWVVLAVWLATFFMPSGRYALDDQGRPIAGSFERIDLHLSFADRLSILLQSPVNGLYGIQNPETGIVAPWGTGTLFGGAQVFLFILAIGGFMTVVFRTGALDLGIAHLAYRFRDRGAVLIVLLSVVFGVLGSVMSWSDETLGFYALLVPLMIGLGYDRMVAVAVITVAPFAGVIGSTVNPFRIGVGSSSAGVTMGDGLGLRLVMFALVMAVTIAYTLRYAARVKADPATSVVGFDDADRAVRDAGDGPALEPLTGRHKTIVGLVVATFALLTFSIVPWGAILHNTVATDDVHATVVAPFSWELGWWLPELSVMFLVMAIVIGVVARLGEKEIVSGYLQGIADFSGPAALVVLAKAVSVILTNTQTIDTVLSAMEGVVSGATEAVFLLLLALVSLPLGFFVGSGSAGMALVMPILAPLGDFAGVARDLVITTYNAMGGWMLLILPTNVLLMAGLALARVGFNEYLRFVWRLAAILLGVVLALLLLGLVL